MKRVTVAIGRLTGKAAWVLQDVECHTCNKSWPVPDVSAEAFRVSHAAATGHDVRLGAKLGKPAEKKQGVLA